MKGFYLVCLLTIIAIQPIIAQEITLGTITNSNEALDAYTLFSPLGNEIAYLVNNEGRIMNQWESEFQPGNSVYLMEDGSLFRAGRTRDTFFSAGGVGGIIEKYDWDGNLVWSYTLSNESSRHHHDFQVLPNGNLLVLAWELMSEEEVLQSGRNPALLSEGILWPEMILEIEPLDNQGGSIVWEWHSKDHLIQDFDDSKDNYGVVSENSGKIDINYVRPETFGRDWMHANAINYNADLDQIVMSVLHFDEIWVIDHSYSTEETKTEKGDLLYRWGNPQAYKRGNESDKLLFGQHNSHWIPEGLPDAGKILIFNNGRDRPDGDYTTVVKIDPTVLGDGTYAKNSDGSFLPETYFYEYTSPVPTDFYSWFISGAQQLSSGNLLINDGAHGTFFEINESEEIVWKYINPVVPMGPLEQGQLPINQNDEPNNGVFRATKYEKDYAAFNGRTLTPGDFVQLDPQEVLGGLDNTEVDLLVYPNPGSNIIHIKGYSSKEPLTIELFQIDGKVLQHQSFIMETTIDVSGYQSGTYFIRVNKTSTQKLILN